MGRILAIDYGTKRTGIAVSDPLRLIAGGLDTVDTKGLEAWLAKYFASEDVSTIVVGKPSRMDGTPSETWRFIEQLAVRLFEPELVINAATVKYTLDAFRKILPVLPKDCILSDIASVKTGLKKFYNCTIRNCNDWR